jgi:predicted ribosomally synthesized peptide with SipW-like signal peptide
MMLIYDIIPPEMKKRKPTKRIASRATKKAETKKEDKFLQIVTLLLAVGMVLNWAGFSGIVGTIAYLNDSEESANNAFVAGALDFVLGSPNDFSPSPLGIGESASREINFSNNFNFPKYKVRTDGWNGELCDFLILEASLDGGASFSMPLKDFISGEVDFSEPDLWSFKLTLPADAPEIAEGQACQFNFIFDGSQIKNDLPFGMGFNDTEEISSVVVSEKCEDLEIQPKSYWVLHPEIYSLYLPVTLGNYVVDTPTKAKAVFSECWSSDMSDRLRCQLMVMKFNVAHFRVGEYFVESCGCGVKTCGGCTFPNVNKTINEIIIEADNILKTVPQPEFSVLGRMTDLLVCISKLVQVEICGIGGEEPIVLINKVYYDVDAEHGEEEINEVIELYNPSRQEIDISNWIIGDNAAQDVIPASTIIPSRGYVIITGNSSTFDYWDIPSDVIKIVLSDGEIGDGLDNDGDSVILKTSDGVEVDAMSYGTDIYAFDPSCADVEEGHMLGRSPNGFDSDTAADWKDYGLPSVNVIYPNGGETWYVGRSYTIQWSAINPSGGAYDILIDLYYSADSGATWGNIVKSTENDGKYYWRVPLFIGEIGTGYYTPSSKARIKAVAHNAANFMVNDWDMTDEDFCPPIDYSLLTPEEAEYLMNLENLSIEGGGVVEEVVESVETFVEEIFSEEPVVEEPASPDASQGGPVIEEPVIEEPAIEEPIIENNESGIMNNESAVEETTIAEPETIIEEPMSTDPTIIIEELIAEPEIIIEEPVSEEVVSEPVIGSNN